MITIKTKNIGILHIIISIITVLPLESCYDKLNQEIITDLTKEQVDKEFEYKISQATYLYNGLENGRTLIGNAMLASICDEAEYTYNGNSDKFNTGAWNEYDNPDDVWDSMFSYIRYANDFINSGITIDLEAYHNDPDPNSQQIYESRLAQMQNLIKEARFLRAYYYFELIKRYGGVPLITKVLELDDDFSSINRNTLQECVEFIVKECTELMDEEKGLPLSYNAENFGRATCVAAAALKSRTLLYAASDLWNSPQWAAGYPTPDLISVSSNQSRTDRWKSAANAAVECLELAEKAGLSLNTDYSLIGLSSESSELILARRESASNSFEKSNFPIGYTVGNGSITPSQNLVDDYEMSDGTMFDWNNQEMATAPYVNRDPRLAKSIYYNGAKFRETTIDTYTGGRNGRGIPNATKTGYYLRKLVDESLDLLQERTSYHCWPIFRLAEIYLNGAEALNEFEPSNSAIGQYINMIRQRMGINMPPIASSLSQDAMREVIRHERRIELAFEGHRYWDVKRWQIAEKILNTPIYGIEFKNENSTEGSKIIVEQRIFSPKMYFYPIPQKVLSVSTINWPQNPLW